MIYHFAKVTRTYWYDNEDIDIICYVWHCIKLFDTRRPPRLCTVAALDEIFTIWNVQSSKTIVVDDIIYKMLP